MIALEDRLVVACHLAPHYPVPVIRAVLDGRRHDLVPHLERDLRANTPAIQRARAHARLARELVVEATS